jgi:RND family efflux transporter MFP subunit
VSAGGGFALPAASLAERVLKTMFLRKVLVGAVILSAVAGTLFAGAGLGRQAPPGGTGVPPVGAPPGEKEARPAAVTVSRPRQARAAPVEDFVGRLEPCAVLPVRSWVSGQVGRVHFKAGAEVKKGDPLFQIGPFPFDVAVAQREADLAQAQAHRKLAEIDLERARRRKPDEVDDCAAALRVAGASVKVAQEALERAHRDLESTRVRAPSDGTVSAPRVALGDQVAGGVRGTELATVTVVDPIRLRFDMDERSFLRYQKLLAARQVWGALARLRVGLADEQGFPHEATFERFDDRVDPATGTVAAHGSLPNPGRRLLPGMFVRVRVSFGEPRPVLEVPEEALGRAQGKPYVWVVNDQGVVEQREVKVGWADGGLRVIEGGLLPEEWVVTAGMKDLHPGDRVEPRRAAPPKDEPPGRPR